MEKIVIYRMRIYRAVPENLDLFNRFFNERLLPVQMWHGARLIGRWQTEDSRVIAVWEYDCKDEYERIQNRVRLDPDSIEAQKYKREHLPELTLDTEQVFMTSTVWS